MRALLVAGVLVLAGCAGAVEEKPSGPPAEPQPAWASCDAVDVPLPAFNPAEALLLPRLGADFVPTAVVVCRIMPERQPDGSEILMKIEGRASDPGDVQAVLTAVRLPTEPRTQSTCTADLPGVPWFALVDGDGRWVRPGVPADRCGKIRIEVRQAVEKLTLTRISARKIREIESSAAAASGCGQQWADMVWAVGQMGPRPGEPVDPFAKETQVRVCLYQVPVSERGSGKPAGTFERSHLSTAEALQAAVLKTTEATACTTPASRFALVRPVDGTIGELYAELDGCQRVLIEPPTGPSRLGKADPTLIALLTR